MIFPYKEILQSEKFYIFLIALAAFSVMLPVLIYGVPFGFDLPHHYQCAMTFQESILSGDLYPSWSLNRNFGFGGMETRLYPPVSHYTLALFYLVVGNWHIASWLTFLFFAFLGGYGVYLWACEYMPSSQAVFAGCIYIFLPYHLNQLYNTFFFAEFVGSSILPFTFVFVSRVCKRGKLIDVIGLAVSFAALILTHLPLTVIGSICFTVYGLSLLKRDNFLSQAVKLGVGVLTGLAATSFFWIKVIQEKDLMAKTLIYPDPWLDYRLHFLLTPVQTFVGELQNRIFETATMYYDLMFLCGAFLAISCTLPFIIYFKIWKQEKNIIGVWIVFALSIFLAIPASRFLWDVFPLLQEVQFPWRWVAILCIAASVLSASKLNYLVDWFKNNKRPYGLIVCGCILFVVTFSLSQIIRQAPIISRDTVRQTIEQHRNNIGFPFWWTIWTKEEAFENKEKVIAENRTVKIKKWTATEREFYLSNGIKTNARIALFYHPNWEATINGLPAATSHSENGAIVLPIPKGESTVYLKFTESNSVKASQWISLMVWIILLILGIKSLSHTSKI